MTLLLVIVVVAGVLAAVGPAEVASAVHFVADPVSFVDAPVGPPVLSEAVDVVVEKVAFVRRHVCPEELTVSVFLAELVGSLVLGAVGPLLHALAVLLVVDPVTLVFGAVSVRVLSVAVGLVVLPIAIVDIAIGMDEPAASVSLVIFPVSFINTAVAPYLVTSSMLLTCLSIPFTFILCSIWQCFHRQAIFVDSRFVVFVIVTTVLKLWETLSDLLNTSSLLLQFFWIHFYVNGATHQKSVSHLKAIYFLYHFACQEPTDKRLSFDDRVYWVLIINFFIPCF